MSRESIGYCEKCRKGFKYYLIHNGFNESSYAYCEKCGKVAFFSTYSVPESLKSIYINEARHHVISRKLEPYIEQCECGGFFKNSASPRCPHCYNILLPVEANKYIKPDSQDKHGWPWQNNWTGTYAIVIEDNKVNDNWKLYLPKLTFKEKIQSLLRKICRIPGHNN